MSQFNTEVLLRRVSVLLQTAWPDVANKVSIGRLRTQVSPPYAAVICETVARMPETIPNNTWNTEFTIYGRFPFPGSGTVEQARDDLANDAYDAIQTRDGTIRSEGGTLLLQRVRCDNYDRKDYAEGEDASKFFDIALTFSGKITVAI